MKMPRAHYIAFDEKTTILNMPREDWLRAQRRHYNFLFNYSQIEFKPPDPPVVNRNVAAPHLSQRRHFGGLSLSKKRNADFRVPKQEIEEIWSRYQNNYTYMFWPLIEHKLQVLKYSKISNFKMNVDFFNEDLDPKGVPNI